MMKRGLVLPDRSPLHRPGSLSGTLPGLVILGILTLLGIAQIVVSLWTLAEEA